jgi:hypothetical protein
MGITLIWFLLNLIYRKEIVTIQKWITVVLLCCVTEMTLCAIDFYLFNINGRRNYSVMITSLIIGSARAAISRVLVIAVAMGYGIVRIKLGRTSRRHIICMGLLYFIFELLFEGIMREDQIYSNITRPTKVLLALPIALLNSVLYWWTFITLWRVMEFLKQGQQHDKLTLYRAFTIVLSVSLVAAIGFAGYQMVYSIHWLTLFDSLID